MGSAYEAIGPAVSNTSAPPGDEKAHAETGPGTGKSRFSVK